VRFPGGLPTIHTVETFSDTTKRLRVGRPVRLMVYSDQGAIGIKAVVSNTSPLEVRLADGHAGMATEGTRLLILIAEHPQHIKTEAIISNVVREGDELTWRIESIEMDPRERRKYERRSAAIEVELKLVEETDEGSKIVRYNGTTLDLSMGGAWVLLNKAIEVDSLVEFQATLPTGREFKALGKVAGKAKSRAGMGIEFTDYTGNSRNWLFEYFNQAA
jgi:hypothetical protein